MSAKSKSRVTTANPGRGCYVACLDGVQVRGVYGSRQEAVESLA